MFDDFETFDQEAAGFEPAFDEPEGLLPPREASICLGHEAVEKNLLELIDTNALPHALILNGVKGIGKSTFAFRLARYLLKSGIQDGAQDSLFGEAAPANKATSLEIDKDDPVFSRVMSGGHPDLLTIERPLDARKGTKKGNVDVETARKVAPFLRMTSSKGGWRVVIIDDADTMNRNAQNAMLKILEEPPKHALILLVTHRLGALIPTIRSRCRVINFNPLDLDIFKDLMAKEVGSQLKSEQMLTLNALAQGSVGNAQKIIQSEGLEIAEQILTLLENYPDFNWVDIHHMADQLGRAGQDEKFKMFETVFLWVIQNYIYALAKNEALPAPFLEPKYNALFVNYDLKKLLEILENLQSHFNRVWFSNLDKRNGVIEAFNIIKG